MMNQNHVGNTVAKYPRMGVLLSSGGGRGVYAHTGFLSALETLKLPITALAGCSAGALVGGIVASGTSLPDWVAALNTVQRKEFWRPASLPGLLWCMFRDKGRGITGISDTKWAIEFCQKNLHVKTFEECQFPFYALAIDLDSGEKTIFSEGELAPRIMASAAIPIVYQPVHIDDKYFCDGAVVDFAPTDAICCLHNLDVVIVHHVSQRFDKNKSIDHARTEPWTLLKITDRLLYRNRPWYLSDEGASSQQISSQRCPCGCGAIIIVIEPELPELTWPMTKGGAQVLYEAEQQTIDLLTPYQAALQTDPRGMFPKNIKACDNSD
ncbi:MAG: patatin-like phospholipase family protein [Gammaproteobacteria bacterium]|nr:patatin-like phospholipase family protein [Gammaproteobacteria bacterium]